jgi:7,8-dihydropterin-6-yl-methyl-4-(beta-D-ribofuranosyl)aminobenzene 5'-phosphate synthase
MAHRISFTLAILFLLLPCPGVAQSTNRVTILYDAFGKPPAVTKGWGFSAFVEYGGKRILFDAGGNAEIFEHNVKALGVDVSNRTSW